jgi:hypothetical protein
MKYIVRLEYLSKCNVIWMARLLLHNLFSQFVHYFHPLCANSVTSTSSIHFYELVGDK